MQITKSDIEKIAELAHLEITPDEVAMFTPQMTEIVTYVEQLNVLDTSHRRTITGRPNARRRSDRRVSRR